MKKVLFISIVIAMVISSSTAAKAVEGRPTGWGWCSTCQGDRGPGHDFTHGQG